jgi:hypothetical protein
MLSLEQQVHRSLPLREFVTLKISSPELQRPVDEERVQDIVRYQSDRLDDGLPPVFIGTLILARDEGDAFWLLDGQHRAAAMRAVAERAPDYTVGLTVLQLGPTLTLSEAFRLINRSQPVPTYIVESTLCASRRNVLDRFGQRFCSAYGPFVSKAKTPRRPNINVAHLQDRIHDAKHVIEAFTSGDHLFDFVEWVIDALPSDRAQAKAEKHGCRAMTLGEDVEFVWLADPVWIHAYASGAPAPSLGIVSNKAKREAIPQALRFGVWNRDFGEKTGVGQCFCCKKREITLQTFHCGHVQSVANGGATVLDNLVPLCAPCNQSMGACDFDAFAKRF